MNLRDILAKLARDGIDALTDEEKAFLKTAGATSFQEALDAAAAKARRKAEERATAAEEAKATAEETARVAQEALDGFAVGDQCIESVVNTAIAPSSEKALVGFLLPRGEL